MKAGEKLSELHTKILQSNFVESHDQCVFCFPVQFIQMISELPAYRTIGIWVIFDLAQKRS